MLILLFFLQLNATILLLQQMGLIPTHGSCRKCDKTLGEEIKEEGKKRYWVCRDCNDTKTYIRSNTVLENSNLRFDRFVNLIYSFAAQNTTYKTNKKEAYMPVDGYVDDELSGDTVNRWNKYFRWICSNDVKSNHRKIGGRSRIIEMDESVFGKMKFGKGNPAKPRRKWVFGGKCRETGRVFVAVCPNNKRTKKALWPIIMKNVKIGSMLFTDGWRAYRKLPVLGFRHRWVDHSKYYVHPDDPNLHTNGIEGKWGEIKRWLPSAGRYNLEQHLNLYTWCLDQKLDEKDPFWSLIDLISKNNTRAAFEASQNVIADIEGVTEEEDENNHEETDDMENETSDSETDDNEDDLVFSCPWCLRYYETKEEVNIHLQECDQK